MTHRNEDDNKAFEEDDMRLGRRDYDGLQVIDTENLLTKDELQELKRLASLSRTARIFVIAAMALVSMVGFPAIIEWFHKHVSW